MSKSSKVLRSRRVLRDGQVAPATVVIQDGVIEQILSYSEAPEGAEIRDLGDLVLMAGLTDVHVHVNEPGRTHWEGFTTATLAAAAGGVTTLIDMPLNSAPVTTTAQAFAAKRAAAEGHLSVDVGFWGGVIPPDIDELPGLLASGVLGLKAFLVHSGIEDFPNVTGADLDRALPLIAPTGLPLLVHCELDTSGRPELHEPADPRSYRQYLASRPGRWELEAIELMINLCRKHKARVHIVHLSCAEALPLLRAAKAEGLPLTVETCPHYLVLDAEGIPDGDTRFKCAPPIRERSNRDALWQGLKEGVIDFIATDHSPCPPDLKLPDQGDFMKAWGGIASIQFLLPLVWTEARKRGFGLADVEAWLCRRPADFAGLGVGPAPKGRLAVGYRADLVAWNPEAPFTITEDQIVYRHKVTPYGGHVWNGAVARTWVGGVPAWTNTGSTGALAGRPLLRDTRQMNAMNADEWASLLSRVCGSKAWAKAMEARRPFESALDLANVATEVWQGLSWNDRVEAFDAHPRIGEKYQNNPEQAGVAGATADVLERLAELNKAYETKFGHRAIIFATGKTASQMADLLQTRLGNSPEAEAIEASTQHHKITLFRLSAAIPGGSI